MEAKSDVNAKDYENLTPLHLAAERNHFGVVKSPLLVRGIEVNAKDYDNSTALHIGSQNGHLEVVKLLLEKKLMLILKKMKVSHLDI
ncbi:ankyrin repeat domain-containing protein [Wolbachia endosymbiont of Drosophila mauritiana]|uniref:ankyrin repeat domain-containing protein n=1 Tax=Wolbachia endosymbiont of Drosophila mauritiana TaxID=109663 RepID=UPI002108401C|nr:ankyrin repeat domain-containing protein [Wolbachia endosymbiont of Drosophila mauritiana]